MGSRARFGNSSAETSHWELRHPRGVKIYVAENGKTLQLK